MPINNVTGVGVGANLPNIVLAIGTKNPNPSGHVLYDDGTNIFLNANQDTYYQLIESLASLYAGSPIPNPGSGSNFRYLTAHGGGAPLIECNWDGTCNFHPNVSAETTLIYNAACLIWAGHVRLSDLKSIKDFNEPVAVTNPIILSIHLGGVTSLNATIAACLSWKTSITNVTAEAAKAYINIVDTPKCVCGSEAVGSPRHSSWCGKYGK
jgi:hypothetical protein